jgi:NAD-dependent dihydropyrimidine dehydrogenase PreA subunit
MCQFCVQHGDGKRWYLEASTYAYDLDHDLERREYLVGFVRDFGSSRAWTLRNLPLLDKAPQPLRDAGRALFTRTMKKNHFGQPVPIEECEQILDIATSVVRLPCPCRYYAGTPDEGYCLAITTKPIDSLLEESFADYDTGPDVSKFQRLTKAETVALLRRTEDEGLMHSVWTFQTPFIGAICNCDLESGCMAMNLTVAHKTPIMFKGEYIAMVDAEECSGCAACVERCPFSAIALEPQGRRAFVDPEACYGCGTCRSACSYGAIALRDRVTGELLAVPEADAAAPTVLATAG